MPDLDGMRILLLAKRATHFRWQPANMYLVLHEALTSHVESVPKLGCWRWKIASSMAVDQRVRLEERLR